MSDNNVLKPSDLLFTYTAFQIYIKGVHHMLSPQELEWLSAWEAIDLAMSPMPDDNRRWLRYGHYLGWFNKR